MPVSSTRRRKSAISSSGSARARHWPADLVKICSASQRDADRAIDRARQAAGDGQVSAEPRHQSPKTSARRTGMTRAPCCQASGGRPALTQVCRRNCSAVQPHSVATCGSSRPRRRPLDDQTMDANRERVGLAPDRSPRADRAPRSRATARAALAARPAETRILARGIGGARDDLGGEPGRRF